MELFSPIEELSLIAAKARVEHGRRTEKTNLMGNVQNLAETIDQQLARVYGIKGSIFEKMAEVSYELERRGIIAHSQPTKPLNEEYMKVVDRLVASSALAPYPHGFKVTSHGLETCFVIPTSDNNFLSCSIGKDLTLEDDRTLSDNTSQSLKLTVPGDHYNYGTEKISLRIGQCTPQGNLERHTVYMFPNGSDGYAKQSTIKINNSISYPLTTHPFSPELYDRSQQVIKAFRKHIVGSIPRLKLPIGQF